jgi:predicted esterase
MRTVLIVASCTLFVLAGARYALAQDNIPSEDFTVPNQPKQRYFLIGDTMRKAPEAGFGLLLVLPGGDGSAEFNPFVKNIYANALPEGYFVAQLVAVPSKNPNQIVWPTAKNKDPKQNFTTESFIADVVKEVKAMHKIDDARVFTLSWSSGGPAAYAASLAKGTPIKGSLVAMSVFLLNDLKPLLPAAKGQRYYLLHSPQDEVCKYMFVKIAKTQLSKAGATVQAADYEGGHGWHGDVFGNIRAGIEWLEEAKR